MTLDTRAREVARGGRSRETARLVCALIGVVALGVGFQFGILAAIGPGALLLGYVLGAWSTNVDRMFMEGFADGFRAGQAFAAPAEHPGRGEGDVPELPASPGDDEPGPASGGADEGQRRARGTGPPGDGAGDLDAPLDVPGLPRPARSALDTAGSPAIAQRPRGPGFPIPPAAEVKSPVAIPAEPKNRRRSRRI